MAIEQSRENFFEIEPFDRDIEELNKESREIVRNDISKINHKDILTRIDEYFDGQDISAIKSKLIRIASVAGLTGTMGASLVGCKNPSNVDAKDFVSSSSITAEITPTVEESSSNFVNTIDIKEFEESDDFITKKEFVKENFPLGENTVDEIVIKGEIPLEKIEFIATHEVNSGDRERPIVIMTYDDGGSIGDIEYIMKAYESYGFSATFFVTGEWLIKNKEFTKEMIDRGFEIGCHGWDHANMVNLSDSEARKQIEDFISVFKEIDPEYELKYIRFPYGSRDQRLRDIAASYGLQSVMWSDESGGKTEETLNYILDDLSYGSIVLSHSTRPYDISMVRDIIVEIRRQGYDIVSLDEGLSEEDKYPE